VQRQRILVLAANPDRDRPLDLDEETRSIEVRIRSAEYRDAFEILPKAAVRADEVIGTLLRYSPDIVHFAGHGDALGNLYFVGQPGTGQAVATKALQSVFRDACSPRLVFLNACYSDTQAPLILESVDAVVAVAGSIDDASAVTFAGQFYEALAYGRSVGQAFRLAMASVEIGGLPDEDKPRLLARDTVDVEQMVFCGFTPPAERLMVTSPADETVSKGRQPDGTLEYGEEEAPLRLFLAALQAAGVAGAVLIVDRFSNLGPDVESGFAGFPWRAVLDFDSSSDDSGLLQSARSYRSGSPLLHVETLDDVQPEMPVGTDWLMARGLAGKSDSTEDSEPWRKWLPRWGNQLNKWVRRLAAHTLPGPATVVVVWNELATIPYAQSALEMLLGACSDAVTIVAVGVNEASAALSKNGLAEYLALSLELAAQELAVEAAPLAGSTDVIRLPSRDFSAAIVDAEDAAWITEDLELVHLAVGLNVASDEVRDSFLSGYLAQWSDLAYRLDVERDETGNVRKRVEDELERNRAVRVNLFHEPGAGGSTVARRLCWDLHRDYPTAVVRRISGDSTASRVTKIARLTGRPVLLLVDNPLLTQTNVDLLADGLRSTSTASVLIHVVRRFGGQVDSGRSFALSSSLTTVESNKFAYSLSRVRPERESAFKAISIGPAGLRTAFNFGLTAYDKSYAGLTHYVQARLDGASDTEIRFLQYIAIAYHYGHSPISSSMFSDYFGLPRRRDLDFYKLVRPAVLSLVLEEAGSWRPLHESVAAEILEQTMGGYDPRTWKQALSRIGIEFVRFCRGTTAVPSQEGIDLVARVFVFRDNAEVLGTGSELTMHYSQFIQDVPTDEGVLAVLDAITTQFADEAHFWAHKGRYLGNEREDWPAARAAVDSALRLEPDDPTLHHMRGMVIRGQVYAAMIEKAPLEEVVILAEEAGESFARARELNPEDEHCYVSDIQMLTRLMEFAGLDLDGGYPAYCSKRDANLYLRDALDKAEDLLEKSRRNREGEATSLYWDTCRAKLDAVYGHHDRSLQLFDSLISRTDAYRPPIRRAMVNTYLARRNRHVDNLTQHETQRIVELLEANLREGPTNGGDVRLWLSAIRHLAHPPSLESAIEQVLYWRAAEQSLDAVYYLYVLYYLQALSGERSRLVDGKGFLEESRRRSSRRRNRNRSFEWVGDGDGISSLVNHAQLGDWDQQTGFWSAPSALRRVSGTIVRIGGPQAGELELAGGVRAFFVPARGGFDIERRENVRVSAYLGFSYDGPRAWDVRSI